MDKSARIFPIAGKCNVCSTYLAPEDLYKATGVQATIFDDEKLCECCVELVALWIDLKRARLSEEQLTHLHSVS